MRIESHLADIQTRASHIERTLLPFRINSSPRFNLNFFKILIGPHFRLMGALHKFSSDREKMIMANSYKKRFKAFMMLPRSTADKLIEALLGNFEEVIGLMIIDIEKKKIIHYKGGRKD
eukprot:GHVR01170690.1.p1 GENE.GHVR01170690.1~~GHVR01170690.1.p1  ORF type:complete len:119 (+),score=10.72 GHVR01170690.1:1718-2074(+)